MAYQPSDRLAELEARVRRLEDTYITNDARIAAGAHVAFLAVFDLMVRKRLITPLELATFLHDISDELYFGTLSESDSSFIDDLAKVVRTWTELKTSG